MRRVWVAAAPGDVLGVLRALGEPVEALAEGRVFVGRRRVTKNEPVARGTEVVVATKKAEAAAEIVWREHDVVATIKPAGIPTVPDQGGAAHSHVANVARALGVPWERLRVTSRLDREVSGVVLFATSEAAERRLHDARAAGTYDRRYVALAVGDVTDGVWTAAIGRGTDPRHRAANGPEAKPAETRVHVVARRDRIALLALSPRTGRTHQIRVHASHAGAPLFGDKTYGGAERLVAANGRVLGISRIALHCARVSVLGRSALAPAPPALTKPWAELGGEPTAWDTAVVCDVGEASG